MSEDPENHTIRLLQEMREEMRQRFTQLEIGQAALSVDLKEVKADVKLLKETTEIIETDMSVIKKRIERIEKHTGLVKA